MKNVVKQIVPKSVVSIADAKADKFYGILRPNRIRTFIIRQSYDKGSFRVPFVSDEMTNGNSYSNYEHNSLIEVISYAMDNDAEVKEFDTAKELFKWLSE